MHRAPEPDTPATTTRTLAVIVVTGQWLATTLGIAAAQIHDPWLFMPLLIAGGLTLSAATAAAVLWWR